MRSISNYRSQLPRAILSLAIEFAATNSHAARVILGVDKVAFGPWPNSFGAQDTYLAELTRFDMETLDAFLISGFIYNPLLNFSAIGVTATTSNTMVQRDSRAVSAPNYLAENRRGGLRHSDR